MTTIDREMIEPAIKQACEWVLYYGGYEDGVELLIAVAQLQLRCMERVRCREDQKQYAQQVISPTAQMSEEMMRQLQINRAQMMQNMAVAGE